MAAYLIESYRSDALFHLIRWNGDLESARRQAREHARAHDLDLVQIVDGANAVVWWESGPGAAAAPGAPSAEQAEPRRRVA